MSAAASPFSIGVGVSPTGATQVSLRGEFDVAAAPDLRAALGRIDSEAPLTLVMSEVTFCDAATVGVLVDERDRRVDRLRVVDPSAPVARLATILDLAWLGDDAVNADGSVADR